MEALDRKDPIEIGPFTLLGRLGGAGSWQQTYLGRDPGGDLAAVSTVAPPIAAEPGFAARFTAGLERLQPLHAPWLPRLLAAQPAASPPWMATSYVAGVSLRRLVDQAGPLPATAARALGATLARALADLHALGIHHAGLNPSTVLMAADGIRLLHVGLTPAPATVTQIGAPASILFHAPEQLHAHPVGAAADVFAMAGLIAFATAGRAPFPGHDPLSAVAAISAGRPCWSGVPRDLALELEPCLTADPAARPDAAELAAQLDSSDHAPVWTPRHQQVWLSSLS